MPENKCYMHKNIYIILCILLTSCAAKKEVYLFTSFHEPADGGLRLLYSTDGYKWKDLDTVLLRPEIGKQKIMRDPSIAKGPDGTFHLVWTTEWKGGNGFGHASSKDLINWSAQQYIPVMEKEPTVVNVWAPEIFYDDEKNEYIIVWASCIPGRFEKGVEDEDNNHRLYYTTTADFKTFTPTQLFLDPKFSVIDSEIIKRGKNDYVLVLKDNTRPERNIKVAFAQHALGPYSQPSKPFTDNFTEGPSVAKVPDAYLIYFDAYKKKSYDAMKTTDFKTFTDASNLVSVPEGHKHGTVFMANEKLLKKLLKFYHP